MILIQRALAARLAISFRLFTHFFLKNFRGETRTDGDKELAIQKLTDDVTNSVEGPAAYEKLTVFTAAGEAEISSGYPEQRHGIFTYFLLKGLQGAADANADKKITVGELFNYLKPNVKRTAGARDREQTPSLVTREMDRIFVSYKNCTRRLLRATISGSLRKFY